MIFFVFRFEAGVEHTIMAATLLLCEDEDAGVLFVVAKSVLVGLEVAEVVFWGLLSATVVLASTRLVLS
jgi:hypothetical protein